MFGIKVFSAVINPPQTAILAVGAARPVPQLDGSIASKTLFTLSSDARAIDDEDAARWLRVFKVFLESPEALF